MIFRDAWPVNPMMHAYGRGDSAAPRLSPSRGGGFPINPVLHGYGAWPINPMMHAYGRNIGTSHVAPSGWPVNPLMHGYGSWPINPLMHGYSAYGDDTTATGYDPSTGVLYAPGDTVTGADYTSNLQPDPTETAAAALNTSQATATTDSSTGTGVNTSTLNTIISSIGTVGAAAIGLGTKLVGGTTPLPGQPGYKPPAGVTAIATSTLVVVAAVGIGAFLLLRKKKGAISISGYGSYRRRVKRSKHRRAKR